jgi:hypothetical protein
MGEQAKKARQYILAQAPKREAVPTPFWPDLNGRVFLEDVPADEITQITEDAKDMRTGEADAAKAGAAMICKALVVKEDDGTYSPIFVYPDDRDTVAHLGMATLLPVFNQANAFFGLTPDALAQAKNESRPMSSNNSGTGSVPNARLVP